ncbi:MAG TPA: diacylglycerol kinase family protein [Acidimicrobiales bacterium]|nr:diacylglycerol kinase family protein [Acidimicrobiales bacterium]
MARFLRRAALRGVVSAVVALGVALVARKGGRDGSATAAAAGALVAGSAQELPVAALPAAAVGALTICRARPRPRAAAVGLALGAGVALGLRRVWPVPPRTSAEVRRTHTQVSSRPAPDGTGLTVVVNAAAGMPGKVDIADDLRRRLPGATVVEVGEGDDLDAALARTAPADVVGIAGGDGSVNAAAAVAREAGKPLFVVPAGTLNHFVRDLGVEGVDDAVEALRHGHAVAVDTGTIDGRPFLNTASFGTYSDLVDARERLEGTIGKWPALVVALARLLRTAEPMEAELDGRDRRLWMVFVGNCTYSPPGFAPAWRERLDDGWLDVRLVDASSPFSRSRLLSAVLTGRLASSTVYEAFLTKELQVRTRGAPLRLAHDGETFDGRRDFTIAKGAPLAVYAPPSS